MGNLLNGHEPIVREIVFSKRDHVSGSYYAASTSNKLNREDMETYRMYVCGTSNDLRVALAVTSFDWVYSTLVYFVLSYQKNYNTCGFLLVHMSITVMADAKWHSSTGSVSWYIGWRREVH